jgi:hypothetical protein
MKKRFAYELLVGIVWMVAVLLLGEKGMVFMALLAAQPFIGKRKADEREYQLFYKVGNFTAGVTIVICVIINECSDLIINGHQIGKNWLLLVGAAFIIAHGAAGLYIFNKE